MNFKFLGLNFYLKFHGYKNLRRGETILNTRLLCSKWGLSFAVNK